MLLLRYANVFKDSVSQRDEDGIGRAGEHDTHYRMFGVNNGMMQGWRNSIERLVRQI